MSKHTRHSPLSTGYLTMLDCCILPFSSGHVIPCAKGATWQKRLYRATGGFHSTEVQLAVGLAGEFGREQKPARRTWVSG